MTFQAETYLGKGRVFIGLSDGSDATSYRGNVGQVQIAYTTDKKTQPNFTQGGGGNYASIENVTGIALAIKLFDHTADNMALATLGATSAVTAGAVLDEAHTSRLGGLMMFDNMPDTTVPYVVTNTGGAITYIKDADYIENSAGIELISTADGGSIVDAAETLVDYTKLASNVVQALTKSAQEYKLQMVGLNEARSGKAVTLDVYKAKFGPAASFEYLGVDFGEMDLVAEILADTSIVASETTSQYYQTKMAV